MVQTFLSFVLSAAAALAPVQADSSITVGDIRVTALSSTLVRVEPKGPKGFEDRTTFMVVDRESFAGIPISKKSETATSTTLSTASYDVVLTKVGSSPPSPPPMPTCAAPMVGMDAGSATRAAKSPEGYKASSQTDCCAKCSSDPSCIATIYEPASASSSSEAEISAVGDVPNANCWPLSKVTQLVATPHRTFACMDPAKCITPSTVVTMPDFVVTSTAGAVLFNSTAEASGKVQCNGKVGAACTAPCAWDKDSKTCSNQQPKDNLLHWPSPLSMKSWNGARKEFVTLAGGCPVLPDFAFGTWFTWWHGYAEGDAKSEVERWETDKLPIDVWALDMNWRNTSHHQDWYEHFVYHKLRTYFNDHPYPVASRNAGGLQTSKEEVAFRWQGISEWMARGLTYWWFDHNWGFSIPPPFVNTSVTSGDWDGLDNAAWGSHVYHTSVEVFDKTVRDKAGDDWYGGRAMSLTKFGLPDWRPGMPSIGHQESPAQHRFPVWWTGDGVPLQGSVESMVDAGVHGFKAYVHSDCGGDYRSKEGGDLLRWTTRYSMAPSLVAAGQAAADTGFPFVTRGDLFWPEHADDGANDNTQYIFINDTLVAPIYDSTSNVTTRSVWVPPGDWADAWTGEVVTGPKTVQVSKPYEQQPMWHNHNGGLVITTNNPGLRIEGQDWSELTLEAFPSTAPSASITRRAVYALKTAAKTDVTLSTDGAGKMNVDVSAAEDGEARAWALRVHLRPGQKAVSAYVDGVALAHSEIVHIAPRAHDDDAEFPFNAVDSAPPSHAGHVVLIRMVTSAKPRAVEVTIA
eukprot:gene14065-5516_t